MFKKFKLLTILFVVGLCLVISISAMADYTCSGTCSGTSVGPITCSGCSDECGLNCTCDPPKIACGSVPSC